MPYGLDIIENRRTCRMRPEGLFSDLSPEALQALKQLNVSGAESRFSRCRYVAMDRTSGDSRGLCYFRAGRGLGVGPRVLSRHPLVGGTKESHGRPEEAKDSGRTRSYAGH